MAVTLELRVDDHTRDGLDSFLNSNNNLSRAVQALGDELERVERDSAEYVEIQIRHSEALRRLSDSVRESSGKMRLDDWREKELEGTRIHEEMLRRQSVARRRNILEMVDSLETAGNATSSLSEKVKYLNQLNITPRGYEMYSYRMVSMFEQIGMKGTLAFGAIAAAAGTVAVAVKRMVDSGDPAIIRFRDSTERLSWTFERLALTIGRSEVIANGIDGISESVETFAEIINEGAPTIRGLWALLSGDIAGARKAREEIEANRKAIEELSHAASMVRGRSMLDSLDRDRFRADKPHGDINDLATLDRMRADEEKRTMELLTIYTKEAEQKEILATQAKTLREIDARRKEILSQELDLKKQLQELDDKAAGRDFDAKRLETLEEVTEELKDQRAELERLRDTHKLTADEQAKRIKQLTELQQRKAELEKQSMEWLEESERRLLEGKVRGWLMEAEADRERLRRQQEFERQQQEFFKRQVEERMRMLGGNEAAQNAMQQLDPRAVRQSIADNRVRQRRDALDEKFAGEREAFKEKWKGDNWQFDERKGDWVSRDQAFNQMLREQAKRRAADLKQTRFGAFSDFNKGRIGADEMRQGQADALNSVIGAQERQGNLGAETAEAMRTLLNNANRNANTTEMLLREVQSLKAMAEQQGVLLEGQSQRVQRGAAQRQGSGRW